MNKSEQQAHLAAYYHAALIELARAYDERDWHAVGLILLYCSEEHKSLSVDKTRLDNIEAMEKRIAGLRDQTAAYPPNPAAASGKSNRTQP